MKKDWIKEINELFFDNMLIWTDNNGAVECWKKYLKKRIELGEKRIEELKLLIDEDKILLLRRHSDHRAGGIMRCHAQNIGICPSRFL